MFEVHAALKCLRNAVLGLCFWPLMGNAQPIFVSFDAPLANPMPLFGTKPAAINNNGVIAGNYPAGGFVRDAAGTITEFTATGSQLLTETIVTGINSSGTVVGYYIQNTAPPQQGGYQLMHCFVRHASGAITHFDDPDAGTGPPTPLGFQGTECLDINDEGTITGFYLDVSGVSHGFVRSAAGVYTSFDPPGSFQTFSFSINRSGTVTGSFYGNGPEQGFVRTADGTITTFAAARSNTISIAINASGVVAGYFFQNNNAYGFLRTPSGGITYFAAPGGMVQTVVAGINASASIAGVLTDSSFTYHGFQRAANGMMTRFEAPGAGVDGTAATGINDSGIITGYYYDASQVIHGFLLTP